MTYNMVHLFEQGKRGYLGKVPA